MRHVVAETESRARETARYHAERINSQLAEAAKIPEMHAHALESGAFTTRPELEHYLHEVVDRNPEIYGSCLAFKPYGYDPAVNGYAPYFYRGSHAVEFVQLADPDYDYFRWPWFREPRDQGRSLWTEPYFDDGGGGVLMTTRSVPFRRDHLFWDALRTSSGPWGVATIDIALTQLIAEPEKIAVGRTGYALIISQSGHYLAFPDPARVMKATLQEADPQLAALMLAGHAGFRRAKDPLRHGDAWIAFAPIETPGFSLALVYPESEVLAEAFGLQQEQLALGVIGLLALFGALFFITRTVSKPIAQLARTATAIAAGDLEQRFSPDAPILEVQRLAAAFNKMTRDLQMRMQELRYTTTVKERIEGELNAARSIQMSLLPKKWPAFPQRREIELHALVKPAREVGGDFYDFHRLALLFHRRCVRQGRARRALHGGDEDAVAGEFLEAGRGRRDAHESEQ